ncbi:MAG: hypothetical protein AB1416_11115 [Actinomycetota bacterium]
MTAERPPFPPASRLVSWVVTSLVVGWLAAYNVIRIAGGSPHGSAAVALIPGVVLGVVVLVATVAVWRRAPQRPDAGPAAIPAPGALDAPARDALRLTGIAIGVVGVIAVVVGIVVALDWADTPAASRSTAKILVAGWDVLAGVWLVSESPRLLNGHGDALESISIAAVLSAVFAGVGLSRGWSETPQVVLIVVAAVGAAAAQLAHWRAVGARGVPWGVAVVVAITILSLVLPLGL